MTAEKATQNGLLKGETIMWTEEQIRAYRLADNKTAELAGWDFDKLEAELQQLAQM